MNALDDSEQFGKASQSDQSPALLTVILDTNPAAWALLSDTLSLSGAVADLLVFVNAHLACNYTNKVAVIASHCDKAQYLYPTPTQQKLPRNSGKDAPRKANSHQPQSSTDATSDSVKRLKISNDAFDRNGTTHASQSDQESNKYRPFRLVEEELVVNLNNLLSTTSPDSFSHRSSTMIAGALTLALSYINRETTTYNESVTGSTPNVADPSSTQAATTDASGSNPVTNALQSRILLITLSPSTDLAHQYIPIMNSIFACQRLNIPIDVLQLPLHPQQPRASAKSSKDGDNKNDAPSKIRDSNSSTVFLQQAADATHGIFIPAQLSGPSPSSRSQTLSSSSTSLLTYLLTAFLPTPSTRTHLILPTRIDVDFRAACFCHRNVISTGFVCSICLSIFCSVPENGDCLTCGTHLKLGDYGGRPIVVPRRKKKKARRELQ